MNIAFAGFRHSHILGLYDEIQSGNDLTVVGCFEENTQAKNKMEQEKGISFSYDSYEKLLADKTVDVVAIGDYYGIRGQRIIQALKAGKHVIADKPICTDLAELEEISRLTEETGLTLCCMLDLRYMPQIQKVKEMVQSGELGKIHLASFTGQHCLDYGNRPDWYFEEGKHGGTINDIAIHGIDLLRLITGENLSEILFSKTWNAFAEKEPDFLDCAQFVVKLGHITVNADVSYAAPKCDVMLPTYWEFTIWGTKGMVRFNLKEEILSEYKTEKEVYSFERSNPQIVQDFLKEVRGEELLMNTKDVLQTQRQILEIQKAADR